MLGGGKFEPSKPAELTVVVEIGSLRLDLPGRTPA